MKTRRSVVPCLHVCPHRATRNRALHGLALLAALAAPVTAQLQFQELPRRSLPGNTAHDTNVVVLADVDGDGDLDLVRGGSQIALLLGDGAGAFADATATNVPPGAATALALGDVDRDGDLDVVGCTSTGISLFENDGTGAFVDVTVTRLPPGGGTAVAFGDVDRDGDLDLIVASFQQQSRLLLNDGAGVFTDATATRMPTDPGDTTSLALGDVDGDGDLDLLLGKSLPAWSWPGSGGVQNRLYINDGAGTFFDATATQLPGVLDNTAAVEFGDVDGDGDLDLVVGNLGLGEMDSWFPWNVVGEQNRLYANDGAGTFTDVTATQLPGLVDRTRAMALGDVDGDGDLDLTVAESWHGYGYWSNSYVDYERNTLLLNDGSGAFVDATAARMPADLDDTTSLALGDVDEDGDLDVVFGNTWRTDLIYFNLERHIDAPQPPRIGQSYSLDAYARSAQPRLVDIAVPFVSLATASIPLPPLGTLGIDPAQMLALPPFLIPQPAGVGSMNVAVPNQPGLVGLPIYMQALLVPYPSPARLSNVVADVVIQ